jgi:hypothetical protein
MQLLPCNTHRLHGKVFMYMTLYFANHPKAITNLIQLLKE